MNDERRRLPSVSALLEQAATNGLAVEIPRGQLVAAIRDVLAEARAAGGRVPAAGWLPAVVEALRRRRARSLRRVINATGVVLHTNLGRAPLAAAAREAVLQALGYSALELDLASGERGSRQDHVRALICELTGAEDALVVNNAAAAVFLALAGLSRGGETIVSRGELLEIGGAFRIPEILMQSGAALLEVGTTNRTRLRDYELAVSPRTRLLLKVHRSNFRHIGFVSEATVEELVALGRGLGLPVLHDVGSGLLISLERFGLRGEPLVPESVAAGALTVFSGDKLLGGPQAGIIAGSRKHVAVLARHPLARALRPDKATLAALEATLDLYRDPDRALREVPVLAMLTATPKELTRKARRLARQIPGAAVVPGLSAVGGGAFPGLELPTTLVAIDVPSCDTFLDGLRAFDPPILARASEDRVVLDPRTLDDADLPQVVRAVNALREGIGPAPAV